MRATRRRFLQLGGAGLAAAPLGLAASARAERVRIGVIGLGAAGLAHVQAFLGYADVDLLAVCDTDVRRLRAACEAVRIRAGGRRCLAVTDYREVCACPDVDAVVIATPNHLHAPVGLAAIGAGKDVYGEPPFAHTYEDGLRLAGAIARAGCVWQAGNDQRADPRFRRAVAAVRGGAIGEVVRVEVGLPGGGRGPAFAGGALPGFHWRWVSSWGGGALAEGIGRYGDTALWGARREDEPASISGRGEYPQDGLYDTATAFCFRCRYSDGTILEVADGGRLAMGVGVRWLGRSGDWVWATDGAVAASDERLFSDPFPAAPPPVALLRRNFIDCVRARAVPVSPARTARLAAALGQIGDRAMRS